MRAVDMLRDMDRTGASNLPKPTTTSFIRERWARHVLPGGTIDRRYYELRVLSELHDRLAPATSGWRAAGATVPSR